MRKYLLLILIFIAACEPPFLETKEEVEIFQPETLIVQDNISSCTSDDDCVIVDSIRCMDCDCVKAINKKYLNEWNKNVTLHANDKCDFVCEPCIDFDITKAHCINNTCEKVFRN